MRLERRLFRRVQLDRNRHLPRFLTSIREFIHDCLIVEERSESARFRDLRKGEYRMSALFEDFAIEFHHREQDDHRVSHHGRGIRWDSAPCPWNLATKRRCQRSMTRFSPPSPMATKVNMPSVTMISSGARPVRVRRTQVSTWTVIEVRPTRSVRQWQLTRSPT